MSGECESLYSAVANGGTSHSLPPNPCSDTTHTNIARSHPSFAQRTGTGHTFHRDAGSEAALRARRAGKEKRRPAQAQLWPDPERHLWQRRFYDFNVWSARKRIEKLVYMHRNPVRRRLVEEPGQWRWSSFRYYACGEEEVVKINQWPTELTIRRVA